MAPIKTLFYCLGSFCRRFENTFQALLSAEFNAALKSWSSKSCVICGPTKIPSFNLASLILGNICRKYPNPLWKPSLCVTY